MKKFIFKLILWILIILIFVFSVCAGLGYLKYKSATDKLSLTNAVEQIKSKENYVKLEDISQDYKNAVVAVEDHVKHPLYKKIVKRTYKLKAHD